MSGQVGWASLWSRVGGGALPAWKCVWATGLPALVRGAEPWTHCLWARHCTGDPCRWQGWLQEELAVGRGSYPFQLGELAAKRWACSTGGPDRTSLGPWTAPKSGPFTTLSRPASEALGTCLFFRVKGDFVIGGGRGAEQSAVARAGCCRPGRPRGGGRPAGGAPAPGRSSSSCSCWA